MVVGAVGNAYPTQSTKAAAASEASATSGGPSAADSTHNPGTAEGAYQ